MKKALITGITGQDGFYLTKLLLEKNYEVHGTIRRTSNINTERIDPLISEYKNTNQLNLHYSDLLDSSSISHLITTIKPEEVYNLGAQSPMLQYLLKIQYLPLKLGILIPIYFGSN